MKGPLLRARRLGTLAALLAVAGIAAPVASAQIVVRSAVRSTQFALGEPMPWVVIVEGVSGADPPTIPDLDWAVVQPTGTQQSMAWVNGRSSARTEFGFSITAIQEGSFSIPPVSLREGGRSYTTDAIAVFVSAQSPATAMQGDPAARVRFWVRAEPMNPVAGQPVIFTVASALSDVRLLAEGSKTPAQYPGFYAEKPGPTRSSNQVMDGRRWVVGEMSTVLYPLAAGKQTLAPVRADYPITDPAFPNGRMISVVSEPLTIDVRPLPPAPPGYAGAVFDGILTGRVDRTTVRADETVELTLRLAGAGNLRLAPLPALPELADFHVFSRQVTDSLDTDNGPPSGAKLLRYSLLPRRAGPLVIPPLSYVTYVPGEGYRTLEWAGAIIEVSPALARGGSPGGPERAARLVPTDDPGGTPWTAARPFVGAALVAFAAALWLGKMRLSARRSGGDDPAALARHAREAAERLDGHVATLRAARARGDAAAFWRAAEEALAGDATPEASSLRERVGAARYAPGGGSTAAMETVEAPLVARLTAARATASAAGRTRAPRAARIVALALVALGVVLLALGGVAVASHPPDSVLRAQMAEASEALRTGRILDAQRTLVTAWNNGARRPGVAIDLALGALYQRKLGEAALWTERARRLDPRHPRVVLLAEALTEEGAWEGLPHGARARTTSGELAFAACVLVTFALLVFVTGRRRAWGRWLGRVLVVAALALAFYASQGGAAGEAPGRAVVLTPVPLSTAPRAGGDIELEPGRAVWLDGPAHDGWIAVRVGSQVRGFVPRGAVRLL